MRTFTLGDVLASKTVRLQPHSGEPMTVTVALGIPVRDSDGRAWVCPFHVTGIGDEPVKAIFGASAMQALILALHTLPGELNALARDLSGSFPDDDGDLGLTHACRTHLTYNVAR